MSVSAREILADAFAATLLILSVFVTSWLQRFLFGANPPWMLTIMLLLSELALLLGFLAALLSAIIKLRRLAAESGLNRIARQAVALRPDRNFAQLVTKVFGNSAKVGAVLGVVCGAIALIVLLLSGISQKQREAYFLYAMFIVVGGVIGVIVSIPIDRAIIKDMQGSACLFSFMFIAVVLTGVLIWVGLGLGELERHTQVIRYLLSILAPSLY